MARIRKHKLSKQVHQRAPKKKGPSKEVIITIIIASVMILSVFGIMFGSYNSQTEQEIYNDFEFTRTSEGWMTQLEGEKVYFTYSPSQLEGLNVSERVFSLLETPVLILSFDPGSEQIEQIEAARLKLAQDLAIHFNKALIYGVTEESDLYNITKYTCLNSTQRVPVIELRPVDDNALPESETDEEQEVGTNIYLEGTCIVIASRERDWLAVTERLLYGMFGVIE